MKEKILNEVLAQKNPSEGDAVIKISRAKIYLAMEKYLQQAYPETYKQMTEAVGREFRLANKCASLELQLAVSKKCLKEVEERLLKVVETLSS